MYSLELLMMDERPSETYRMIFNESKIVHLVGFTIEIKGKISGETSPLCCIESQNI